MVVQLSEAVAAATGAAGISTMELVAAVSALVAAAMVSVDVGPGIVIVSVVLVVEVSSQVVVS